MSLKLQQQSQMAIIEVMKKNTGKDYKYRISLIFILSLLPSQSRRFSKHSVYNLLSGYCDQEA
jgi:hypothetical protein